MANLNPKHIVVGISGGVDSAVAAYLLKKAGHQVEAIFMKNWEEENNEFCTSAMDHADAAAVCEILKIPFTSINFSDQYWQQVFIHFLQEYKLGRTPNPDILCNKEIKFKAFLDYAKTRGADYIATGHYVRTNSKSQLLKGSDAQKDQSYFLYALNESQLQTSLFPLGDYSKKDVRKLAKSLGFKNHNKKDSTGICFIGERQFKDFLSSYLPAQSGDIKSIDGQILGQHDGLMFYTIGQRQGLQIGGLRNRAQLPWYVAEKDLKQNILYVVQGDHPILYKTKVMLSNLHWINKPLCLPIKLFAKTRYRQQDQTCTLDQSQAATDDLYEVIFENPQRAITPGQSMVFYQGDICLGGGIIEG